MSSSQLSVMSRIVGIILQTINLNFVGVDVEDAYLFTSVE